MATANECPKEWAQLRELPDGAEVGFEQGRHANASGSKSLQEQFVLVPSDMTARSEPCSICMEPFEAVYHQQKGEWVWMDVMKVGNKYYHVACYNEVKGGLAPSLASSGLDRYSGASANRGSARNTPDPVLGKRKFDGV
jgi:pre-mRNA cleavage complex 2 protein Pcf11